MNQEEFYIYGIIPESEATGVVGSEELRTVIVDALQVKHCYHALLKVLNEAGKEVSKTKKIDIQEAFKALDSIQYYNNVPPFLNNRITSYTVKIIKASLIIYMKNILGIHEIKDAVILHTSYESENQSYGIRCDPYFLSGILWMVNRVISFAVLQKWVQRTLPFLEEGKKKMILAHEFLFLICNTQPRRSYFSRLPWVNVDFAKEAKSKKPNIDDNLYKFKTPDDYIDHLLSQQYRIDKGIFVGLGADEKKAKKAEAKTSKDPAKKEETNEMDDLRKKLADPQLHIQIETQLKITNIMLNQARLNGEDVREKIRREIYEKGNIMPGTATEVPVDQAENIYSTGLIDGVKHNKQYRSRPFLHHEARNIQGLIDDVKGSKMDEMQHAQSAHQFRPALPQAETPNPGNDSEVKFRNLRRPMTSKPAFSQKTLPRVPSMMMAKGVDVLEKMEGIFEEELKTYNDKEAMMSQATTRPNSGSYYGMANTKPRFRIVSATHKKGGLRAQSSKLGTVGFSNHD